LRASLVVVALLIAAFSIASVLALTYPVERVVEARDYPGVGVRVEYRATALGASPGLALSFSSLNPTESVAVDAFAWLPNGSVKKIGRFAGTASLTWLNRSSLLRFASPWARFLEKRGVRPEDVGIGVTFLATIIKPDGVYVQASVVPIRLSHIIQGNTVRVVLSKKPMKVLDFRETNKGVLGTESYSESSSSPLPPGEIEDGCITSPGNPYPTRTCWYWRYELGEGGNAVYVGFDVPIPLVATVVKSSAYSKVYDVFLHEWLSARESQSISVGITAVAGITATGASGGVSYEVLGFSWEGYSQEVADLHYTKAFTPGQDFSGPSILYVGFRGDISVAPYRLYQCTYSLIAICQPLDEWANITYVRPSNGGPLNNDLGVWGAVSLYDYSNPVVREYLDLVTYGWLTYGDVREATDNVTVSSWLVKHEVGTVPLFSGSFDALSLIMSGVTGSFAPIMSVSIGINVQWEAVEAMDLVSVVDLKQGEVVHWEYAKSPITYGYGDSSYRFGMVYVRVTG